MVAERQYRRDWRGYRLRSQAGWSSSDSRKVGGSGGAGETGAKAAGAATAAGRPVVERQG